MSPTATSQAPAAEVLGRKFTRPEVAGRNLARTGTPLTMFVLIAMVLAVSGFAIRTITASRKA